jgi:hypothetical protein
MASEDVAIRTRMDLFPDRREPADFAELTSWVAAQIALGRRAAMTIAVLIAHARDEYFREEASEWLDWARKEFGYERRHCFSCLKAGRLLLSEMGVRHVALDGCDVPKLEMLSALWEAKPEQFAALLAVWNPAEHTREEVRRKVAGFLDQEGEEEVACEGCGGLFSPASKEQTLCAACQEKKARKAAERKAHGVDRMLGDIAGLDEEQKGLLCREIAPGVAMRAGLNAVELAFMAVDLTGCWSTDDFARWEARLNEILESFRYLASK